MKKKFHKDTFDNIPEDKRTRLIEASIRVLGKNGIANAKIEDIAKQVGISYGSIYTYFASKDDLVHTIISMGMDIQRKTFREPQGPMETFEHIELVLRRAFILGREHPEFICLWHEMSLPSNDHYSQHTEELYQLGIVEWKGILGRGIEAGEIRKDLDVEATTFILDCIASQLLRYHMSDYQKSKGQVHFPRNAEDPIPVIIKQLKDMLS